MEMLRIKLKPNLIEQQCCLTKTKYLLESSAEKNEKKSIQKESDGNRDRKEVISWFEYDIDGSTLRWLMQDCINSF